MIRFAPFQGQVMALINPLLDGSLNIRPAYDRIREYEVLSCRNETTHKREHEYRGCDMAQLMLLELKLGRKEDGDQYDDG